MITRIDYRKTHPQLLEALRGVYKYLDSIDAKLRALVELRVSQINGCVYCVDLHSNQARAAGETQQRLDCLPAWHECPFYDERERAAFAWADALTNVSETHAPDDVYNALKKHFSDKEIADLTFIIAMMNAWNRIAIGFRNLPSERHT